MADRISEVGELTPQESKDISPQRDNTSEPREDRTPFSPAAGSEQSIGLAMSVQSFVSPNISGDEQYFDFTVASYQECGAGTGSEAHFSMLSHDAAGTVPGTGLSDEYNSEGTHEMDTSEADSEGTHEPDSSEADSEGTHEMDTSEADREGTHEMDTSETDSLADPKDIANRSSPQGQSGLDEDMDVTNKLIGIFIRFHKMFWSTETGFNRTIPFYKHDRKSIIVDVAVVVSRVTAMTRGGKLHPPLQVFIITAMLAASTITTCFTFFRTTFGEERKFEYEGLPGSTEPKWAVVEINKDTAKKRNFGFQNGLANSTVADNCDTINILGYLAHNYELEILYEQRTKNKVGAPFYVPAEESKTKGGGTPEESQLSSNRTDIVQWMKNMSAKILYEQKENEVGAQFPPLANGSKTKVGLPEESQLPYNRTDIVQWAKNMSALYKSYTKNEEPEDELPEFNGMPPRNETEKWIEKEKKEKLQILKEISECITFTRLGEYVCWNLREQETDLKLHENITFLETVEKLLFDRRPSTKELLEGKVGLDVMEEMNKYLYTMFVIDKQGTKLVISQMHDDSAFTYVDHNESNHLTEEIFLLQVLNAIEKLYANHICGDDITIGFGLTRFFLTVLRTASSSSILNSPIKFSQIIKELNFEHMQGLSLAIMPQISLHQ